MLFEQRTIQQIPLDQRHGRARDLFTIWFGANLTIVTVATGALCTTVFHLSLPTALFAIIFGNLFGAIFMALHAAQGPHLGVPQMVQTRGQFGARGALAVIAFVAIMYLGFFATNLVLSARSLHHALPLLTPNVSVAIVAALALVATAFGHDLIHAFTRAMSWVCGAALLACFVWIIGHQSLAGLVVIWTSGPTATLPLLLGAISTSVLWQIAYAPYVSDYSRYLPPGTGVRDAFWASYWGCAIGSIAPMALGALLGSLFPTQDIAQSFAVATGPIGWFAIPLLTISIAAASAINLYCGVLAMIAIAQTFTPDWQAGPTARIAISLVLTLVAVFAGFFTGDHFMTAYCAFLLLLLYVMVPWTAINLVDYYLIRHGDYDVASFLRADGGIYGNYNWPALGCYLAGILVQVPFVANEVYTGFIARLLDGSDISWIVCLLVISPLYYGTMKLLGGFVKSKADDIASVGTISKQSAPK
jgi:NCS1 family nucleobase:cation symporter-1